MRKESAGLAVSALRRGREKSMADDETVQGDAPHTPDTLTRRVLSSIALIVATLGACYFGGAAFVGLVTIFMVLMYFEWARMVERVSFSPSFFILSAFGVVAILLAANGHYPFAFALCVLAGITIIASVQDQSARRWLALGAVYICAPCVALIWLRGDVANGRALTILLFAIVWAADTGAYGFGRIIGGPRLSPTLSPAKTWAGAMGGVFAGGLVGFVAAPLFDSANIYFALIGGGLGVVSILGDIAESAVKRRFGVKDASGLIPGHGGVLDRLDGMIFVASAAALVLYGQSLLLRF